MADVAAAPIQSPPHPVTALWRTVKRVDKAKINDWWVALRNSLAVAIPLGIGIAMGNPLGAVAVAIGALNVSYSDGRDPYFQRARRMLLWSGLSGAAVFVGSITGQFHAGSVLTAMSWAFAAGMMLSISTSAGDLGLNTLVTVIVFAARGPTSTMGAVYSGLLVLGGGILQTALALLLWPVRRNEPQVRAISKAYSDLASEVNPDPETLKFQPLRTPSAQIQDTITALSYDRSMEAERFRLLFDQADRLRLSLYLVSRLRDELGEDDSQHSEAEGDAAEELDQFLKGTSKLLAAVSDLLLTGHAAPDFDALRNPLRDLVERAQVRKHDARLRLVVQLATNTTEEGEKEFLKSAEAKPWKLQTANWLATMRANVSWSSPVFRHAVRLSACVGVADVIERSINWRRAYWLPMTVAVVLKPDFATTFSRGALRLGGTIGGLILATVIYHLLPQSAWTQLLLVGGFTFFLRYLGPANYGVFTVAISGLIVFLLAATGVSPAEVVGARATNTIAGGLLALLGYAVWPTWERSTISESQAEMLDAAREYFRAVTQQFDATDEAKTGTLDAERKRWRLKRSAAEAAVDRVASEPGNSNAKIDCLSSIMASSHSLIHTVMGLEAGLVKSQPQTTPEAFRNFANDVELTLYYLSTALRGSAFAHKTLPQLREDHRKMLESRSAFSKLDDYILLETDRLTVSLNTLREQVVRYVSAC